MWADDDYPSARTRSLLKLPLMKELVDSDESDLGTVDITAVEGSSGELDGVMSGLRSAPTGRPAIRRW